MGCIRKVERTNKTGQTVTFYRADIRRAGISKSKVCATKSEAKNWLRDNESAGMLAKHKKGSKETFRYLVDVFIATPAKKGTKYWKPSHLDFWIEQFGDAKVSEIDRAKINTAVSRLQTKDAMRMTPNGLVSTGSPVTGATVNRYIASLNSFFNFAMHQKIIDTHPIKAGMVAKAQESNGRTRTLTDGEEQRLLDAASESRWPMLRLYILFLLTTGARKAEPLKLRWHDLDLQNSVAVLRNTKNGESRELPLVPSVRAALADASKIRPLHSDLIFYDPIDPSQAKNVDSLWKHACLRAGLWQDRESRLDWVSIHTLRHTAATKMIRGGASTIETADQLGHKSLNTTKRYVHSDSKSKVALAERLLGKVGHE